MVVAGQRRSEMSVGSHRRRRPPGSDAPRRSSLLRVGDWRVRTKLGAALVVPVVAFLVLAGLQTGTVANRATVLDEFAGQVGMSRQVTALVHELQLERDRTLGELATLGATATPGQASARLTAVLQPIHRSVDTSTEAFRAAARDHAGGSAAWRSALSAVNEQLNQLSPLRDGILGGGLRGTPVSDGYTRTVNALLALLAQPSPGDAQRGLSQPVLAYLELARAKEVNSLLRGRLFAVASAGKFSGTDKVELSDLLAQQLSALAQFRAAATAEQVELYERTLSAPDAQEAVKLEESATAAAGDTVALDPAKWWTLSTAEHDLVRQVETRLVDDAVRRVDGASSAQWRQTVFVAGLILLVLLAAMAASVAIGRSMARSLRQLRGQALGVAQLQLPRLLDRLRQGEPGERVTEIEAPTVRSADEIGDVAEAFYAVHRSAVHLAVEQATMRRNVNAIFVNLARRSQVLVERQLELLDRLERGEGDPDQLANLFQLDHLAARMRRNDDNLLVLAGSESRRRWTEPVALSTVVLAAVAEIEQYPRVQHDVDDQLYLVGRAVGDLAHLLAELLENATMFSPPHGAVVVAGGPGPGRAAVIEITDGGIGMSPRALEEANNTLATPPLVDVAAAERMGLVVVSHLAARHGIRVQLRPASRDDFPLPATPPIGGHPGAAGGGLVATVWLPPDLLAPAPVQPDLVDAPTSGVPALIAHMRGNGARRSVPAVVEARPGWRGVPTRAEDVLGAGVRARSADTAWWSRPVPGSTPQPSRPTGRLPDGPPEVPVTGGVSERGLPLRVPMAQLPTPDAPGRRVVPTPRVELDPEAVGSALARFYGGVRQAQAEDAVVPVFRTGDGNWTADARYEEEQR